MKMTNFRILLLTTALSITIGIGNSQMDDALRTLYNAGIISYTLKVTYNPEKIPVEKIVLQLKNLTDQMNSKKFQIIDDDSYDSVQEIYEVLTEKYGFLKPLKRLSTHREQINDLYKDFSLFVKSINTSTSMIEIDHFFSRISMSSSHVTDTLKHITHLSIDEQAISTDWFILINQYLKNFKGGLCGKGRLTQDHIFNYYTIVFDMELRASFLLITAYRHLTIRRIENHQFVMKKALKNSAMRLLDYSKKARNALKYASTEILRCDDRKYIKNRTYAELHGISQGFLIDPAVIKNTDTCQVSHPKDDICKSNSVLCFHRKCSEFGGKINDCRDLTEGRKNIKSLSICPSEDNEKQYSWLEIDDKTFGRNNNPHRSCPKPSIIYGMVKLEHKHFLLYSWADIVQKKVCFCNCERAKWKPGDVRIISLLPSTADYFNNRVITDVKFKVTNGIIQLRARHGIILSGGRIDQTSLTWIDAPDPIPSASGGENAPIFTYKNKNGGTSFYMDDDFEYISSNLTINLDDLRVGNNYVVVEVSFKRTPIAGSNLTALELEICGMEYDSTFGKLNPDSRQCVSDDVFKRQFLDLGSPDNPVNIPNTLKNDISKPQQSVSFQQTNWKNDLGQSIVPFFDLRPVKPKIALPLSGIGIYHRGCRNCGGFISMKLFTHDMSDYIPDK